MATFDLGRVTPIYKGDYNAATSYELNDVVLYDGNLYWHHKPTATVGVLPTDTTVWGVVFTDEGVRAEIRGYADNAQNSADSALSSKAAAAQSASQAASSASSAAQSAQTAQTAETGATASAQTASTKASEASASATSAEFSARTAIDRATLASQKAAAASESASLATAKASAAATSETNAVTAANTATTKASEAAASATSAQEYDESAQQSAVNAQTSATNAAASAASAQGYSEAATQSAEDAAESASRAEAFYYLPTDTAEGAIATFTDGADDVPVKSLVVGIEPVQDLHGQDSPYPAGGGKNVLPPLTNGTYTSNGVTAVVSNNNVVTVTGTPTANANVIIPTDAEYIPPDNGYIHIRNTSAVSGSSLTLEYNWTAIQNASLSQANNIAKISNPEGKTANRIRLYFAVSSGALNFSFQISVESDSGTTDWSPYSNICPISGWTGANVTISPTNNAEDGETFDITFPTEAGTVYGGSLDVINGVLTVDRAMVDMGSLTWSKASTGNRFISNDLASVIKIPALSSEVTTAITSTYRSVNFDDVYNSRVGFSIAVTNVQSPARGNINVADSRYANVADFAEQANGVSLCYPLATPIVYQLTPTEVKSLLGQNNIWTDTGDTTVEYRADTSAYIAKKIAEAISVLS